MKRFFICLLAMLSFVAFSVLFHGCAAEEEVIEEKAPDTEVDTQEATEEGAEETEKTSGETDALEMDPSSAPKGMKEAKEGEGK